MGRFYMQILKKMQALIIFLVIKLLEENMNTFQKLYLHTPKIILLDLSKVWCEISCSWNTNDVHPLLLS